MATRIPENVVTAIREETDIVDIISPYVPLKKKGRNLFGACPFHEERTASFSVNEEKQIFHCFSCGRGGNVFSFIMDIEQVSFPKAVEMVAEKAGRPLDAQYTAENMAKPVDAQTKALQDLYREAMQLYHHLLVNTAVGEEGLAYVQSRGLDEQTVDTYMLGYAPNDDVLLTYFQNKGIDYQVLRSSELFVEWSDGSLHDRFTNRVLFPIRDQAGQPIAFSGRKLASSAEDEPKYMNSPESLLFNKSKALFNLDLAQEPMRQTKHAFLFEGFMDVIAAFRAGIRNGVASMGTALTVEHIERLKRSVERVTLVYDADAAGQAATKRALDLLDKQAPALDVQIVHIPDGKDPDEYLRAHGPEALKTMMAHNTEDPISFQLRYLREGYDLTNQSEMFAYIDAALHVLATIKEPIIRETYLTQLSEEFNLSMTALSDQLRPLLMRGLGGGGRSGGGISEFDDAMPPMPADDDEQPFIPPMGNIEEQPLTRLEKAEQMVLAWMLRDQDAWLQVTALPDFAFADVTYETLYLLAGVYREQQVEPGPISLAAFMDFVQNPEQMRILGALERLPDDLFADLGQLMDYVKVVMQDEPLAARITHLKQQLAQAKQTHNDPLIMQLSVELIAAFGEQQALKN